MQTFRPMDPPAVPSNLDPQIRQYLEDLRDHLMRLGLSLHRAANAANPSTSNQVLHAPPKRAEAGMEVYADGVDWNPGSGEGKYRRDKTNTTWTFIG